MTLLLYRMRSTINEAVEPEMYDDPTYDIHDESDEEPNETGFKMKVVSWLHSVDIYAKPITLFFNKKPGFATVPGGIWTIITFLLSTSFIFLQV